MLGKTQLPFYFPPLLRVNLISSTGAHSSWTSPPSRHPGVPPLGRFRMSILRHGAENGTWCSRCPFKGGMLYQQPQAGVRGCVAHRCVPCDLGEVAGPHCYPRHTTGLLVLEGLPGVMKPLRCKIVARHKLSRFILKLCTSGEASRRNCLCTPLPPLPANLHARSPKPPVWWGVGR